MAMAAIAPAEQAPITKSKSKKKRIYYGKQFTRTPSQIIALRLGLNKSKTGKKVTKRLPTATGEQACNECGQILPLCQFHRNKRNKNGYRGKCKGCSKIRLILGPVSKIG
jgi:hypothetical protein